MRKLSMFGFATLAAVLLACSGTGTDETTQGPGVTDTAAAGEPKPAPSKTEKADEPGDGKQKIVFEVTGKGVGKATSITYGVGGNTSQANGAKLPWKKQTTSAESFLILSLVAQSGSGGNGTISCRITVDGKVIVKNSSQGAYAVVTCSETA